ncbi:MAG TPA: nucleotidyltransferase family protein [Gemmatimonadaceae bacterium]|nr:nucleotidyltransferase family protein [Gemmatimonadaceae bacterium]
MAATQSPERIREIRTFAAPVGRSRAAGSRGDAPTSSERSGASPWTHELELIARLSRLHPTEDDLARARALAAEQPDWERALRLAGRHGVASLVDASLAHGAVPSTPADVRARVRQLRLSTVRDDLARYDAWLRLSGAFEAHGIRAVTLKGFHVVLWIYGQVGLRSVGDLDFLVRREDVGRARSVLEEHGYQLWRQWHSAVRNVGLDHVVAGQTEMPFISPRGIVVDLHWEAGPRGTVPPSAEIVAAAEALELEGCTALVPPPSVAIVLLLLHGHRSAWSRLRWLVDLAEGISKLSSADFAASVRLLRSLSQEAALVNALCLMDSLWARLPGPCADVVLPPRAGATSMLRYARRALEREQDPMQTFDAWRPLRMVRDRAGTTESLARALASACRPNHFDWAAVALPRPLRFGYYAVRPVRLLSQALAKARAAPAPPSAPAEVRVRERVPYTFVSAIYDSGPSSLLGGRGRDIAYYLPSLVNIANLGAPIVLFCAPHDVERIERAIAPHFRDSRVVPFALSEFEHYDRFLRWKESYRESLGINDRNEVLCFLKSYWVQRAIADNPFGHESFFWIDAGLTHHGIIPERVGGVELLVTAPASRYYPENRANIFTPRLGAALGDAITPGRVMFCALPFSGGRRVEYERVAATTFGRNPESVRIEQHLVGGIFGGRARDLYAVHRLYARMLGACIEARTYTLEEQAFSAVHAVHPELFSLQRFSTWHFHSPGERTSYLAADGDSFFKIFERLLARATRAC